MIDCFLCGTKSHATDYAFPQTFRFTCSRCGTYILSKNNFEFSEILNTKNGKEIVSHWVRKNQSDGKEIFLDLQLINNILKNHSLPKPKEQANNLILWLGEISENPHENVNINISDLIAVIGTTNVEGVDYVLSHITNQGFMECETYAGGAALIRLTFLGWDYYYELKSSSTAGEYIFMAMKYNNEDLEKFYKDYLKTAILDTGFELRRLDEKLQAGLIDNQMRVQIRQAKLLLADLSHDNPGAYWEAGFAEGLGVPVIYLCEEKKFDELGTHFDTNHHTTIKWNLKNPEKALNQLKSTIRETFPTEAILLDKDLTNSENKQ